MEIKIIVKENGRFYSKKITPSKDLLESCKEERERILSHYVGMSACKLIEKLMSEKAE